jgi:CBS domain containing-hemolysin-like protein
MHVVFGELIPKTLALQSPDLISLRVAAPLMIFTHCARPFIALINGTGNRLLNWFGLSSGGVEALVHSVEELRLLVNQSEKAGVLSATQSEYARRVFRLSGKNVHDCMVPRNAIAALEVNMSAQEALAVARQALHTRMPVYEGTLDNIVGVVNTKDLFARFSLGNAVLIAEVLYSPLFLQTNADVADALQLFRSKRKFLAIVRKENVVLGLITMEDILEEIVGDIEDEHDAPRPKAPDRFRP